MSYNFLNSVQILILLNACVTSVIKNDADAYYVYCPELPGCYSQGDSFEEVSEHIKEAIELNLETLTPQEARQNLSKDIYIAAIRETLAETA